MGKQVSFLTSSFTKIKLVYIIPLIWDKSTINFHEWDQFFNFHECWARMKIMRIYSHEWKSRVNFRKSVVLRANSGIKYQDSPIDTEEQKSTINTPSAENHRSSISQNKAKYFGQMQRLPSKGKYFSLKTLIFPPSLSENTLISSLFPLGENKIIYQSLDSLPWPGHFSWPLTNIILTIFLSICLVYLVLVVQDRKFSEADPDLVRI